MTPAIVIGAGPAGLMAAEVLADAGYEVSLIEAKPTFGRKFLMAGKSGLNITKDEPIADFVSNVGPDGQWLSPILSTFPPDAVKSWAIELGQDIFTGSSGMVFPKVMKASPLLRNWMNRLSQKGVYFYTDWRWSDWRGKVHYFDTPEGKKEIAAHVTVFAMGGASWARLGADGHWAKVFGRNDICVNPFQPANMGFNMKWSSFMDPYMGRPVKPVRLTAGDTSILGEFVLSQKGIEGSGIYAVSREMRGGAALILDLCPDQTADALKQKMATQSVRATRSTILRKVFNLSSVKAALVNEFARGCLNANLVDTIKAFKLPHLGPRDMDEAISTAGGVAKSELTDALMLHRKPGVFCAGEMLDWEAPTGGYLINACLATGRTAGLGAVKYLRSA